MPAQNTSSKRPSAQMEAQAQGARDLFTSRELSDLTITCKDKTFKVHKFQLCTQAEYFYKAFTGDFKEAQEGKIDLQEDDPQAVEAMLYYMYHGTYNDPGNSAADSSRLRNDIKVFRTADKYDIALLKKVACEKFSQRCASEWDTVDFTNAIRLIYNEGPPDRSLRNEAVTVLKQHIDSLIREPEKYPDFHEALRTIPEFAADVLIALSDTDDLSLSRYFRNKDPVNPGKEQKWVFRCPGAGCGSVFCVKLPLARKAVFGCPFGYSTNQSFEWWMTYEV